MFREVSAVCETLAWCAISLERSYIVCNISHLGAVKLGETGLRKTLSDTHGGSPLAPLFTFLSHTAWEITLCVWLSPKQRYPQCSTWKLLFFVYFLDGLCKNVVMVCLLRGEKWWCKDVFSFTTCFLCIFKHIKYRAVKRLIVSRIIIYS